MKAKYRLEQFGQVLNLRNRDNAPYLLIGRQAVSYWASRYQEKEPLLGERSPFTSEDGELTARDWLKIARYLLKQTATKQALRAAKALEVDWSQLLPWEVLKSAHDPRLIRFREAKRSCCSSVCRALYQRDGGLFHSPLQNQRG